MLTVRIIPCLDVKDGRVVGGVSFAGLRDPFDPVAAALVYEREGADEILILDLSETAEGRAHLLDIAARVAAHGSVPLTMGARDLDEAARLLRAGADRVSIGVAAAAGSPGFVSETARRFGSVSVQVAIDARAKAPHAWEVFTHGGEEPTGLDAVAFAKDIAARGAGEILLTSMDRDGTRKGPDIVLTRAVADAVSVPVIAAGGIGSPEHVAQAVCEGRAAGVVAASIFHFGTLDIAGVKSRIAQAGIPIRSTERSTNPH